jgi:hypothetical protein
VVTIFGTRRGRTGRGSTRAAGALAALGLAIAVFAAACPAEETAMPDTPLPRVSTGQDGRIAVETDLLKADVTPTGYVSGVAGGTLVDKTTGARDHSFGLDIVDFLMGPGDRPGSTYESGTLFHGNIAKHYIEGPQVCTQAKRIEAQVLRGPDFVAVRQRWTWTDPAPGYTGGSVWRQTLVFPMGRRHFLAADSVTCAGAAENVFLRIDMPGHIRHTRGDTFREVYLSYEGRIPASDFYEDFPPDARHLYRRGEKPLPKRFIRARLLRGEGAPYLAGITLDPAAVWEAWCHQRGYVCFIQEIGGWKVRPGDHFGAAYAVGYFDSVQAMETAADGMAGYTSLEVTPEAWVLSEGVLVPDPADPRAFGIVPQGAAEPPKTFRVLLHGRGEVTLNGLRVSVDGDRLAEVPGRPAK